MPRTSDDGIEDDGDGISSELVLIDRERLVVAATSPTTPYVANLNVSNSASVHIGPRFINITQNIQRNEVIAGQVLGFELISPRNRKNLRCSLVVVVFWALVSSLGLAFYFLGVSLNNPLVRIDIDLPFHKYVWNVAMNTTTRERVWCGIALAALLICIIVLCFTLPKDLEKTDLGPSELIIPRPMWLSIRVKNITENILGPVRLVIVQETSSIDCNIFAACAAEMRHLQKYSLTAHNYDVPYNFVIGNDGRVYEGRGWNKVGAHTDGYDRCSLGIGFFGDYREEISSHTVVKENQMMSVKMLLKAGVELGYLHPEYQLVGAKDLKNSESPGTHLYRAIQLLPHYDRQARYRGLSCDQIHALYN